MTLTTSSSASTIWFMHPEHWRRRSSVVVESMDTMVEHVVQHLRTKADHFSHFLIHFVHKCRASLSHEVMVPQRMVLISVDDELWILAMRHSFFALECFIFSYYVCIGSFQCGSSLCSFILLALYGLSLQGNQKPLHLKTPKLTRDVLLPHCLLPPQIAELGAELQELIYQGLNLEQIDLPHGPCRSKRHFVGVELLNLDNCPSLHRQQLDTMKQDPYTQIDIKVWDSVLFILLQSNL